VKVVVNDLGGSVDGTGGSATMAEQVVAEIKAAGGQAIANGANVTKADEVEAMVAEAIETWGHVDILVNNAGILRDKSFSKMTMDDFRLVVEVHLMGSAACTKITARPRRGSLALCARSVSKARNMTFGSTRYRPPRARV